MRELVGGIRISKLLTQRKINLRNYIEYSNRYNFAYDDHIEYHERDTN